jgi:hypothetical protein
MSKLFISKLVPLQTDVTQSSKINVRYRFETDHIITSQMQGLNHWHVHVSQRLKRCYIRTLQADHCHRLKVNVTDVFQQWNLHEFLDVLGFT